MKVGGPDWPQLEPDGRVAEAPPRNPRGCVLNHANTAGKIRVRQRAVAKSGVNTWRFPWDSYCRLNTLWTRQP